MLLCPVRACHLPLVRDGRRLLCANAHSFDVAASGYINLLQPQDRRSKQPGDTKEAVAARRRLHDLGVTAPLLRGIAGMIDARPDDIVLDAGCGDGFYLGTLAREFGFDAHGLDISTPAIDAAARRFPPAEPAQGRLGPPNDQELANVPPSQDPLCRRVLQKGCQWIVANADRFIPYADRSFSLVLSITARMNTAEFRRVLKDDGRLLVALPSPEDLQELRGRLGESGRDRVERTIDTFAPHFTLSAQRRVTTTADLSADAAQDVLLSIYRPLRSRPVEAMRVTFSLDLLLFHCQ